MIEKIYNTLFERFNFEPRKDQIEMSLYIDENMLSNNPILVEAETGSGKTMAYLIPTILKALNENKNVVISTNTLNLQDQLLKKELPIIEEIFGEKIEYTLIKGRSNYVCKRKLQEYYDRNKKPEISKLIDEIFKTKNGDRSELKSNISTNIWSEIASEKETTLYKKCPFYETCFYYNKKRENEKAKVFVVNHHILMLDRILRNESSTSLIPDYQILIIDEAHNLENVVRKYYSYTFSFKEMSKCLGLLYNRSAKSVDKAGLILKILSKIEEYSNNFEVDNLKDILIDDMDYIYDNIMNIMKMINEKIPNIKFNGNLTNILKNIDFKSILNNIESRIKEVDTRIGEISKFLENNTDIDKENEMVFLNNMISKVISLFENLKINFEFNFDEYIYWVKSEDGVYLNLNATPYYIAERFYDEFIKKVENMIFVSATLTTNSNFDYLKQSLGIKESNEKIIKSSFDYKNQMNLLLPTDISEPNSLTFRDEASKFILDYTIKNKGKTFVLFTSYIDLECISEYLKEHSDLNILKQGDYERVELIRKFKKEEKSVLLGTDSFWEGVDIQGEALSSVIIMKMPFQVPDDPIVKSISEKYGSRSFVDFQLPYAIIKLKQGVGRLIRSKNDKGNVIILDKRLYTKSYGKIVLKSLPNANIEILDLESIISYNSQI